MKKYQSALPYFPENEIEAILEQTKMMLGGGAMLSMGENVSEFEQSFALYCGVDFGIATNSCTSALSSVFKVLEFKKDDEVILPAQTFFANLSSVVNAGAKPIFCDTDCNFLLSFESLKQNISPKTKAVVIVYFCGAISQDIFKIRDFCKENKIFLIEDCAHAHGAQAIDEEGNIHKAGSIGDVGCFSFFSTKIMTTGEGGMILCKDEKLAYILRSYANRGLDPKSKIEHFIHYGENFRMSEFCGFLGKSQLRCLDSFLTHRNKIACIYKKALKGFDLAFQEVPDGFLHSYWRFIIFLRNFPKESIIEELRKHHIPAEAPYNPLLHKHNILNTSLQCPNAEKLAKSHISLPMHLGITEEDALFIASTLKKILGEFLCKNSKS